MILVLSGRYQGERNFALREFPGKRILSENVSELADDFLEIRSGNTDCFNEGADPDKYPDIDAAAEELSARVIAADQDIVLCHIIGCGVVPADEKQRYTAELVGRTSCLLAKQAEEVWVVCAGIGSRIKSPL